MDHGPKPADRPVEQAIFTSAQTERGDGYQVVAASTGIPDDDIRALATWCPSHDAMLDGRATATSVNFHPLPSGTYCVSRTETAGAEYSGRGGHQLYTHCLVAPAEVLGRFSNRPLALLRAAVASGALAHHESVPRRLPTIRLPGRAAVIDPTLVARLGNHFGPQGLGVLLHAALTATRLALPQPQAEWALAGLLNCLPLETRTEFPFSTSLKFSPRRPYRWFAVSEQPAVQRHLAQQFGVTVITMPRTTAPTPGTANHGWAEFVATCVEKRRIGALRAELNRAHPNLGADRLSALGHACQHRLTGNTVAVSV